MRKVMLAVFMTIAISASAQQIDLKSLDKFAEKAKEKTEITMDEEMLKSASSVLNSNKAGEAAARKNIEGLKGIYLRAYEFDDATAFKLEDLKPLTDQLKAPNWTAFLRNKEDDEQTEIWLHRTNGMIDGLLLIAAEKNELTVINAVGLTRIEDLSKLGDLGLPTIK